MKIRVTNLTHSVQPPTGFFLDFDNKFLPAGRALTIEVSVIPQAVQEWADKGWAKIQDADSGEHLSGPGEAVVTAGTRINEVADSQYDEFDDIGFNPEDAREAALPNGAHMPPIGQMEQPRARVSLGMSETVNTANADFGHTPLPGETPRSVDDSAAFTIRAPRSQEVGKIIGK